LRDKYGSAIQVYEEQEGFEVNSKIFGSKKIVIGVTGNELFNAIFIPGDGVLIELTPDLSTHPVTAAMDEMGINHISIPISGSFDAPGEASCEVMMSTIDQTWSLFAQQGEHRNEAS